MSANPAKDNGLPHWLTTAQGARLKCYPANVRSDMIAILLECRATWERDREREARRLELAENEGDEQEDQEC